MALVGLEDAVEGLDPHAAAGEVAAGVEGDGDGDEGGVAVDAEVGLLAGGGVVLDDEDVEDAQRVGVLDDVGEGGGDHGEELGGEAALEPRRGSPGFGCFEQAHLGQVMVSPASGPNASNRTRSWPAIRCGRLTRVGV